MSTTGRYIEDTSSGATQSRLVQCLSTIIKLRHIFHIEGENDGTRSTQCVVLWAPDTLD